MIPSSFYQSEDVVSIARALLGKLLVTKIDGLLCSGIIVETEAYRAPDDKACHAYNNRMTKRTRTMFSNGGVAYVYICYGIHHLFNVVTGPEGKAHAVLIRAIQPITGISSMLKRRNYGILKKELTNGPGKLSEALGIKKSLDNSSLANELGNIWIEEQLAVSPNEIVSGPRVGMKTAEECSNWPWRFRIQNNPWCSKPDHIWYDI